MIDLYPVIKLIHVTAVVLSGGLFALRGLLLNLGLDWVMARPVRRLSSTIDSILLAAAVLLAIVTEQYPFVDGWLTAKVLLLIVYIVLGYCAFWTAKSRGARLAFWLAALLVFAFIVSIALAHDPRGVIAVW